MDMKIKRLVVGPVCTNCYIVSGDGSTRAVVVDPGDDFSRIRKYITTEGLTPVAILLTHGHFDHIGAVDELRSAYRIPVYALEEEQEILTSEKNLGSMAGMAGLCLEADDYVRDGDVLTLADMEFQVIATPGHTVGSCCYYLPSEDILFSGDTLFQGSYGRIDFPTGSGTAMMHSICDKLLKLKPETRVYPGHEAETTIGAERTYYVGN